MVKRKEDNTDTVQALQSQDTGTKAAVKADPKSDQSQQPENEAQLQQAQQPEGDSQEDLVVQQNQKANVEKPPAFMIICRNKISKMIGGVSFTNGVGYTSDGYKASWFGNKEGYEVRSSGGEGKQP